MKSFNAERLSVNVYSCISGTLKPCALLPPPVYFLQLQPDVLLNESHNLWTYPKAFLSVFRDYSTYKTHRYFPYIHEFWHIHVIETHWELNVDHLQFQAASQPPDLSWLTFVLLSDHIWFFPLDLILIYVLNYLYTLTGHFIRYTCSIVC